MSINEMPGNPPKSWLQSRTMIFNILSLVVGLALTYGFDAHTVAPWVTDFQLVVTTVVNLYLRTQTTRPLA